MSEPMSLAAQKKALRDFKRLAKAIVKRMADARDDLRTLVEEYGQVLEHHDYAAESFEDGLEHISQVI
jgi:hypothetical protein